MIDHKLDPARHGPPQTLTESEVKHIAQPIEELIRVAIPELEDLARVLRDAGYCVNFADASATMLISRLPSGSYGRVFRDLKVYTGSNFAESCEGTNAVDPTYSRSDFCIAGQKSPAETSRLALPTVTVKP